jgi:hypothetical protein
MRGSGTTLTRRSGLRTAKRTIRMQSWSTNSASAALRPLVTRVASPAISPQRPHPFPLYPEVPVSTSTTPSRQQLYHELHVSHLCASTHHLTNFGLPRAPRMLFNTLLQAWFKAKALLILQDGQAALLHPFSSRSLRPTHRVRNLLFGRTA